MLGACLSLDMVMKDTAMPHLPSATAHINCAMRVCYCLIHTSLHSSEVSNSGWSNSSSGGLAILCLEPKVHSYSRILLYLVGSATSVPSGYIM